MNFKKLTAAVLAAACVLSIGVPAIAAPTITPDMLVDADGYSVNNSSYDTLRPGEDYYYIIGESSRGYDILTNKDYIKFSLKKTSGGKYIKDADIVEKRFNNTRYVAIEFSIKDNFSSDEYKVELEAQFRAKKDLIAVGSSGSGFPIFRPVQAGDNLGQIDQAKIDTAKNEFAVLTQQETTNKATIVTALAKLTAATTSKGWNWTEANMASLLSQLKTAIDAENAIRSDKAEAQKKLDAITAEQQKLNSNVIKCGDLLTRQVNITDLYTAFTVLDSNHPSGTTVTATSADVNTRLGTYAAQYPDSLTLTNYYYSLAQHAILKTSISAEKSKVDNLVLNNNQAAAQLASDNYFNANSQEVARLNGIIKAAGKSAFEITYNEAVQLVNSITTARTTLTKTAKDIIDKKAEIQRLENANVSGEGYLKAGETRYTYFKLWIQNENRVDDDATFVAGEKGVVIKPVKNEVNTVTWENSSGNIAQLRFTADSEVEFYCPRLSTRWNNEDYMDYFEDMDVYLFDFVSNPKIPCTALARLSIYNPFVDRDGELTRDVEDLYVYEVQNGKLVDVTRRVTAETNDDGDEVLTIRTRTLGTYIVSDRRAKLPKPVEPVRPSNPSENKKPDIIVDANKKPIPNTGI